MCYWIDCKFLLPVSVLFLIFSANVLEEGNKFDLVRDLTLDYGATIEESSSV